jgi:hypothetical protein
MDDAWGWAILFGLATLVSGYFFAGSIQMRVEQRYSTAWALLILASVPLAVWTFTWTIMASPPDGWRRTFSVLIGAIVGAVVTLGSTELLRGPAKAQSPTPSVQEIPMSNDKSPFQSFSGSGNFSINQQGGSINQTYINQVPEKLKFTAALGSELLTKIGKEKPVKIMAVGSSSDRNVGEQIGKFLHENGYVVTVMSIGVMGPPPEQPITLTELPSEWRLIVAPGVR